MKNIPEIAGVTERNYGHLLEVAWRSMIISHVLKKYWSLLFIVAHFINKIISLVLELSPLCSCTQVLFFIPLHVSGNTSVYHRQVLFSDHSKSSLLLTIRVYRGISVIFPLLLLYWPLNLGLCRLSQLSHGIRAICSCIMRSIHPYLSAPSSITSLNFASCSSSLPLSPLPRTSLANNSRPFVTLTDSLQRLSHLPSTICNLVDPPHPSLHLSEVLYTSSALFSAFPVLEISVMHHAASPALVFILPGFY